MPAAGAPCRADLVRRAAAELARAGIAESRETALQLWCRAAGESRSDWALRAQQQPPAEAAARFARWLERCARGEPLAYLEGRCSFHGLDLLSDSRALVPRADSEALVECALRLVPEGPPAVCADLGVGSGCLLAALLHARPGWRGVGVDRSAAALELARANLDHLGLTARASLMRGDWLEAVRGPLQLIVANPPYVAVGEELGPGVAEHEPHDALFAPADDPLGCYRRILERAGSALAPGGLLLVEVGFGRAGEVAALAAAAGWSEAARQRDLGGVERALALRPPAAS
jgi:release factor glutamine methyltransferase